MIDLPAYFRREAAIHALPRLMADYRAKQIAKRSAAAAKGWETRRAQA
jgi:hypothetical protein